MSRNGWPSAQSERKFDFDQRIAWWVRGRTKARQSAGLQAVPATASLAAFPQTVTHAGPKSGI